MFGLGGECPIFPGLYKYCQVSMVTLRKVRDLSCATPNDSGFFSLCGCSLYLTAGNDFQNYQICHQMLLSIPIWHNSAVRSIRFWCNGCKLCVDLHGCCG